MVKVTEIKTTTTSKAPSRKGKPVPARRKRDMQIVVRPTVGQQNTGSSGYAGPRVSTPRNPLASTVDGLGFLQGAYAPPDFEHINIRGVPDAFNGRTLVMSDHIVNQRTFQTTDATTEMYILALPTPGIAYWIGTYSALAGWSAFAPVRYPGYKDIIPSPNFPSELTSVATRKITDFRTITSAMEVVNNDPDITVAGSISVLKGKFSLSRDQTGDLFITGGFNIPGTREQAGSSWKWKDGAYAVGLNTQPDFEFQSLVNPEYNATSPGVKTDNSLTFTAFTLLDNGGLSTECQSLVGIGSLEGIIFKISGYASGQMPVGLVPIYTTNFTIRTWQTNEYKVNPTDFIYRLTSASPPEDKRALDNYREMINVAPVAVRARDNDNFWKTLLSALGKASSFLGSIIPGGWGLAATAAGMGLNLASSFVGASRSHNHPRRAAMPTGYPAFGDYSLD